MQEYYRLWFSEDILDPIILYRKDLRGINEYLVFDGLWVEDWPQNVTLGAEGKNPKDYLTGAGNNWIIVSRRVQQVFAKFNIQGVQFLPVSVEHQSGIQLPGYALLKVLKIISALDVENTVWLRPEREQVNYPNLNIVKVALSRSAIQGLDIFRLKEEVVGVYVSKHLVECLTEVNATSGFRFDPVLVS